ncbi:phospholipid-translocating P-type ATPase, flippase subfamily protein [Besnoitia besnoiti]|uniref:P-type phospholipid transporter n=1 Tax=Besnoitia besnoiti TaxID=94643 RepID=A0A2A9MFZ0_BESBE|nr:phospholipid-translocating P-type ATPase, flippase subfamily protein [Besnoitia besnoiti]PFH34886.1 phospholipid-translocating P-type ATPase, flippase subfamily protein [Besnoitia besnoiti]
MAFRLAEQLEVDLELQGVTGVEDRLQEGAAMTIKKLRQAGIHVWMLTGDKTETALNVGLATSLLVPESRLSRYLWDRDEPSGDGLLRQLDADLRALAASASRPSAASPSSGEVCANKGDEAAGEEGKPPEALIVDGEGLAFLLGRPDRQTRFIQLCCACRSVICCRVAPHQKGAVVSLVKAATQKVTLAIGDGANDCNMIRQAHIGVGIRGNEGHQAFNCSDFGLTQFRLLLPLLLVHGRYCYRRVATVVLYILYKNILLVFPLIYFGFLCLFSGQRFYPELLSQIYNPVLTAVPITLYGVFERDVDRHASLKFPLLYRLGQMNSLLNPRTYFTWIFRGAWHAAIIFVVAVYAFGYDSIPGPNGKPFDMWMVGTIVMAANCLVANFAILFASFRISFVIVFGIGFSMFSCVVLFFAASTASVGGISTGALFLIFESFFTVLLYFLVVASFCLGLLWFQRSFRVAFWPELVDLIHRREYAGLPLLSLAELKHLNLAVADEEKGDKQGRSTDDESPSSADRVARHADETKEAPPTEKAKGEQRRHRLREWVTNSLLRKSREKTASAARNGRYMGLPSRSPPHPRDPATLAEHLRLPGTAHAAVPCPDPPPPPPTALASS